MKNEGTFTTHVTTNFWSGYSVDAGRVAAHAVLEVAPLGDLVEGEEVASGVGEAGALTVMHGGCRELVDNVVAAVVSEVIEADVWMWMSVH